MYFLVTYGIFFFSPDSSGRRERNIQAADSNGYREKSVSFQSLFIIVSSPVSVWNILNNLIVYEFVSKISGLLLLFSGPDVEVPIKKLWKKPKTNVWNLLMFVAPLWATHHPVLGCRSTILTNHCHNQFVVFLPMLTLIPRPVHPYNKQIYQHWMCRLKVKATDILWNIVGFISWPQTLDLLFSPGHLHC